MKKRSSKLSNSPTLQNRDFKAILELSNQIMHFAISGFLRTDFLREVSKLLMWFSGSDAIVIWLNEGDKFYRSELLRSRKTSFSFEIMPGVKNKKHGMIPKLRKKTRLERLSRDVFLGQFDTTLPCFTTGGGFWTCNERAGKARSVTESDYMSIILVPISAEKGNMGLLALFKVPPDCFSKEDVEIYQRIAQTMGVAFGYRLTQVQLRERVKELLCLYEIAKIAGQEDLSLDEILRQAVRLLPEAWLYPRIASARITYEDRVYATPHYQDGVHKQTADIVLGDLQKGIVEVTYSEKRPELYEGPFLKEERNLIEMIAKEIALIIERTQIRQDKEELKKQIQHADRLATIGQLSAGVAHELNEPIGSILGFAQLVQKDTGLSDQSKCDAEKIMKASLHAREVIKKLMLFARQMPPHKTRVNLNQIIKDSLYFLESRCAKEGIKVICQLSPTLPDIIADQAQMTQVLVNIIVNAIQAMPDGGQITVQTRASDSFASLILEDTGVGMEEKIMSQIFQPFFTTKDVGTGTGLGLSVVYGIVTSHGGSIHVESNVGRGTKIMIQLPCPEKT